MARRASSAFAASAAQAESTVQMGAKCSERAYEKQGDVILAETSSQAATTSLHPRAMSAAWWESVALVSLLRREAVAGRVVRSRLKAAVLTLVSDLSAE
jgi:hypothetical protein